MRQTVLERRVELLKLEGIGMAQPDIVKQLSDKYGVSTRQLQHDFHHRHRWQGLIQELQDPDRLLLKIHNRNEHVYQRAAYLHLTADNDNAKIGALRLMLEANKTLAESVILAGVLHDLDAIKRTLEVHPRRANF